MGILSQRLIILMLATNLILSWGMAFYTNSSIDSEDLYDIYITDMENITKNIRDNIDDENLDTSTYQYDQSYGKSSVGWRTVKNMMFGGIFFASEDENPCNNSLCTPVERIFLKSMGWLIVIINFLLFFEVMLIVFKGKTT